MENALETTLTHLPPTSRVWIYQSDRSLSKEETDAIETAGRGFVEEWSSHGRSMAAGFAVMHRRFLVIAADEAQAQASGCGIDRSVHFIQGIGAQLGIDFFDRMSICYLDGEATLQSVKAPDIPKAISQGLITPHTEFFDNLVTQISELETQWLKPMSEAWTARYF